MPSKYPSAQPHQAPSFAPDRIPLKRKRRRRPDLKQQFDNEPARSTGGVLPGKELARNLSEFAPQRLPDVLVG